MRDEEIWQLGDELRALARLVRQLEKRLAELEKRVPPQATDQKEKQRT